MGWGKFNKGKGFKNPLSAFSDRFETRNNAGSAYGGTLSYSSWFTGDASIFGGIEWYVPYGRGLKIKIENEPFDYFDLSAGFRPDASFDLRKSESDINIGLSIPIKKYGFLDLSFIIETGNCSIFDAGVNFLEENGKT